MMVKDLAFQFKEVTDDLMRDNSLISLISFQSKLPSYQEVALKSNNGV